MYEYYEEDYIEKSQADEIIEKAINDVSDLIKTDVSTQIKDILEKERTYDERCHSLLKREVACRNKEQELENKERDLELNFKRKMKDEKFSEIFKSLLSENHTLYGINYKYDKPKKCESCNEDSKLTYKMPSGEEFFVNCECSKQRTRYFVQKFKAYGVEANSNSGKVNILIEPSRYDDELSIKLLEIKEQYKEGDCKYSSYYKTEKEAQKLADKSNKTT